MTNARGAMSTIQIYTEYFAGTAYPAKDEFGNPINEIDEIKGWRAFWREDPSEVILRPEIKVISAVEPYLDPPRTNGLNTFKPPRCWILEAICNPCRRNNR